MNLIRKCNFSSSYNIRIPMLPKLVFWAFTIITQKAYSSRWKGGTRDPFFGDECLPCVRSRHHNVFFKKKKDICVKCAEVKNKYNTIQYNWWSSQHRIEQIFWSSGAFAWSAWLWAVKAALFPAQNSGAGQRYGDWEH